MTVIPRAGWGARPPLGSWTPWSPGQPSGHTIHWEGAGGSADHGMCAGEVRSIQLYHQTHGYVDIAYNWVVCIHGVIFEGRPASVQSAAQRDGNRTHIAICYMAGSQWPFTTAGQAAISYLCSQNAPDVAIPHQDEPSCQTSCAGGVINQWVRAGGYHHPGPVPPGPQPPPPPHPVPPQPHHPLLRIGSSGPAVYELQAKLRHVSGKPAQVDGLFGPLTQMAVRDFQAYFHLQVDGIAGPQTWGMVDYCNALKH